MAKKIYHRTNARHTEPLSERLMRRSIQTVSGCRIWTGAKGGSRKDPRGRLTYKKQWMQAHVAAWIAANGPIPEGMLVCHTCDTGLCIEPNHLFLGTAQDNSSDMVKKRRSCIGERHGQAKLSTDDILAIRGAPKAFGSGVALADQYGVSPATICNIRSRKNWRHM